MKTKLMIFVLATAVAAFAQHGASGTHMGGMGGSGMGGGMGASSHASASDMGRGGDMGHGPSTASQMGNQSPSTILASHKQLSTNLEKFLPQGTSAQDACSGFTHLGPCVAAIHVAYNLKIPFADLKAKMTGTTSEDVKTASDPVSLGKAIHELKPDVNAKAEAKKGQKQANDDLNSTGS